MTWPYEGWRRLIAPASVPSSAVATAAVVAQQPSAWDEPLALNLFPDAKLQARVRSAKTTPVILILKASWMKSMI